jgi:hypothetical protein
MSEEEQVFSGPWHVRVDTTDAVLTQQVQITGSDSSDGTYPGQVATEFQAMGESWTLRLLWLDGTTPRPSRIRRSATYTAVDGLIVTLGADDGPPETADGDFNDMIVVMKSRDPALDPLSPAGNPYDYTIPERFVVGGHLPEP